MRGRWRSLADVGQKPKTDRIHPKNALNSFPAIAARCHTTKHVRSYVTSPFQSACPVPRPGLCMASYSTSCLYGADRDVTESGSLITSNGEQVRP